LAAALQGTASHVAVVDSMTGGELSARLAAAPSSTSWYRGAVVACHPAVGHSLLAVPPGPEVSRGAVVAMARRGGQLLDADLVLALSGVAGPEQRDGEAPGTVWLARLAKGAVAAELLQLRGDPEQVVSQSCDRALAWLVEACEGGLLRAEPRRWHRPGVSPG
jgi:nicotinamide-nucleotide amidase